MDFERDKAAFMRKLFLCLVLLGLAALPVRAAPIMQPALAAAGASEQAAVQTVQYGYDRRENLRRQEFRRRQEIRRERFRRRQAGRRGYARPY